MLQQQAFLTKTKNNRGYIALMSVLIISAIGVIVATSLLSLGLSYQRSVFVMQQQFTTQALARACANVALQKVRLSASYTGDERIYSGAYYCDILPIEQAGEVYIIKTTGVADPLIRKSRVVVSRTEDPDTLVVTLTVESWKEVTDF